VPTGVALFPREIIRLPRAWAAAAYNIQQWRELPKGGHFAALEQPELLLEEITGFAALARSKGWV
jgi:pimeloyl-ACP methyl ester carboxylesterase